MPGSVKKTVLLTVVFFLAAVSLLYAVDAGEKDQSRYPLGTFSGSDGRPITTQQLRERRAAKELEEKKVSPEIQPEVPRTNLCAGFGSGGPVVVTPESREGREVCPPGYGCESVDGGFQCHWRDLEAVSADSPECRYEVCGESAV